MTIVRPDSEHIPRMKSMWKSVFGDTDRYIGLFFSEIYHSGEALVCLEDGRLLSMVFFPRYRIRVNGREHGAGYICGAATHPGERGKGLMSLLLGSAFEAMRDRGDHYSVLIPANDGLYGYYGKFGYLPVFKRGVALRSASEYGRPGRLTLRPPENAAHLYRIYSGITKGYPNIVMQNEASVGALLKLYSGGDGGAWVLSENGSDKGFLFCYQEEDILIVKELMADGEILEEAAAALSERYPVRRLRFEGPASGAVSFEAVKTTGMLKPLDGAYEEEIRGAAPYMNMMLD